jgi:hypothetical protein
LEFFDFVSQENHHAPINTPINAEEPCCFTSVSEPVNESPVQSVRIDDGVCKDVQIANVYGQEECFDYNTWLYWKSDLPQLELNDLFSTSKAS